MVPVPDRLTVRISGSHPGDQGSIPCRGAKCSDESHSNHRIVFVSVQFFSYFDESVSTPVHRVPDLQPLGVRRWLCHAHLPLALLRATVDIGSGKNLGHGLLRSKTARPRLAGRPPGQVDIKGEKGFFGNPD